MKNSNSKRHLPPVALALCISSLSALTAVSCRMEDPATDSAGSEESVVVSRIVPEEIARMFSLMDLDLENVREVHSAVLSSSSNGYDEEYTLEKLVNSPGSGVGDERIGTKAAPIAGQAIRDLIRTQCVSGIATRSGDLLGLLADSGLQIYWPYSEDWDGQIMPAITFDPGDDSPSNTGWVRTRRADGRWSISQVTVDEEYSRTHPVWIINRNEDACYLTPQILGTIGAYSVSNGANPSCTQTATKASSDFKTLRLKEIKAHRNFDSIFAGGSEVIVKLGALNAFKADVASDIRAFSPEITDMVINIKRKQVGMPIRLNTVLVSEWTSQLEDAVLMMVEDDGGKRTSWKCLGTVKIQSKSYGFEVELPLNKNDDIIWRGKLSRKYLENNNDVANRLGDVSVTFTIL